MQDWSGAVNLLIDGCNRLAREELARVCLRPAQIKPDHALGLYAARYSFRSQVCMHRRVLRSRGQ